MTPFNWVPLHLSVLTKWKCDFDLGHVAHMDSLEWYGSGQYGQINYTTSPLLNVPTPRMPCLTLVKQTTQWTLRAFPSLQ